MRQHNVELSVHGPHLVTSHQLRPHTLTPALDQEIEVHIVHVLMSQNTNIMYKNLGGVPDKLNYAYSLLMKANYSQMCPVNQSIQFRTS